MRRPVGAVLAVVLAASGLTGLVPAGAAAAPSADVCAGVTVVVDLGDLPVTAPQQGSLVACAPRAGRALDVLRAADVTLEGTAQMGLAFVCRVEGRPAADEEIVLPDGSTRVEACRRTPPASAYWSLWTVGDDGTWRYATTGVGDTDLVAGDAFALVYAVGRTDGLPPAVSPAEARTGDLPDGWTLRSPAPVPTATGAVPEDSEPTNAGTDGGPGAAVVVGIVLLVALGAGAVVVRARRSGR